MIELMLNGTHTKMLRKATNVKSWERKTNAEVYEELPLLGNKIAARRMKLTGHCHRHPELAASDLVLMQPNQNQRRRGRPKVDFVEVLRKDAGNLTTTELPTVMEDRTVWRNRVTARLRVTSLYIIVSKKNIKATLFQFAGYIHNHKLLPGNTFGLILTNEMVAKGVSSVMNSAYISLIIGPRGLQCETNLWEIMGWESSDVDRFYLGPLVQGQTMVHWLW